MNKIKTLASKTETYIKDNAVLLLTASVIGSCLGGMLVGSMTYKSGYTDAVNDMLNFAKSH